jgi:hypothetical protein
MLEQLTLDSFRPYVGDNFAVQGGMELQLVECEATSSPAADGSRTQFHLVFIGPANPVLPQQIYSLEHPSMGVLGIFIVPIGPDERGMRYEAVFT